MKHPFLSRALAAALLLASRQSYAAHVYAGIIDTNGTPGLQAGDALAFINGVTDPHDPHYGKAITGADYGEIVVGGLVSDTTSAQHGLYSTNAPTFTALSRGVAVSKGGYVADLKEFAAAAQAFVELKLISVDGPSGAHFSFWESGSGSATFIYTVGTGLTTGLGRFPLTDRTAIIGNGSVSLPDSPDGSYVYPHYGYAPNPAGKPEEAHGLPLGFTWNHAAGAANDMAVQDPFGHIHGRKFTFDRLGQYRVTYLLTDARGVQAPSAPFTVTYSVVAEAPPQAATGNGEASKTSPKTDDAKSKP